MKVREHETVRHVGTMEPTEVIETSINIANMAQIQQMITDLYSDTELAVIREYATNALDAQIEAGNFGPIKVKLPSSMSPTFEVWDEGVGMSHDELRDRFCQYGASSKRETNEAVGMLGVGCKSGLTYASQFTIIAVKDGVKIIGLMTKNDRNLGVLQIQDTLATDEPNGVKIQIPVTNVSTFTNKARNFFRFWASGTVLLDGVEPECIFTRDDILIVEEDMVIVPKNSYNYTGGIDSDYVVMGNVAYPCESKISHGIVSDHHGYTVARVGIGEIDFTPSREALHYTPHTTKTTQALNAILKSKLFGRAQKEVDAQPTRWEGAKEASRWAGVIAGNQAILTYKGERIPSSVGMTGWSWQPSGWQKKATKCERIGVTESTNDGVVLVRNHPGRSMDAVLKDNLLAKYPKLTTAYAICADSVNPEHEIWLEGAPQEEYAEIRPRQKRQKRQPGDPIVEHFKWMVMNRNGEFKETDTDLSPTAQFVYVLRSDPDAASGISYTRESYRSIIGTVVQKINQWEGYDVEFVVVRKPELEKFQKSHPNAQTFSQFIQATVARMDAQFTEDQKAWGAQSHDLRGFDAADILDPETADLTRRLQKCVDKTTIELYNRRRELKQSAYQIARINIQDLEGKSDIAQKSAEWAKKYPLMGRYGGLATKPDHLEYMNALFTYRKQVASV